MVKMKKVTTDYDEKIAKAKTLMSRLYKGQRVMEDAYRNNSITTAFQAASLFNQLSKDLLDTLEECIFIHEYLAMGKTVVINRAGRGINISPMVEQGEIEIDPWMLRSIQALKETFGENFKEYVEFVNM